MKKWLIGLTVLLCALILVVSIAGPALAGYNYKYKGESVDAYWSQYDEVSDIYTEISVGAYSELYQQPPGKPQEMQYAWVDIYIWGPEDVLLSIWCWGEIPAECLVIDGKMGSATLMVTDLPGFMYDYINGIETEVDLDIAIEWTANGPVISYKDNFHYKSPDNIGNYHSTSKYREAIAEGTISCCGNPVELGENNWASISSYMSGIVDVSQ